jgi:hypothetical protein
MASFEGVASRLAQHSGAYGDALAVGAGLERPAEGSSRRPDLPCGETS